jgi:hypothetical protein
MIFYLLGVCHFDYICLDFRAKNLHKTHTNSIENYFSMLKSRLQKLDGLTHPELKRNITETIQKIPKEKYVNIFKGAYERPEKYVSKRKTRKNPPKIYL